LLKAFLMFDAINTSYFSLDVSIFNRSLETLALTIVDLRPEIKAAFPQETLMASSFLAAFR
ncbi:MAG TPA: hypothetical protein PK671_04955, partial [Candidatus Obscuribacter sp.]|nr:hypothetical protein [Candidatus Obscuribacter sp.]